MAKLLLAKEVVEDKIPLLNNKCLELSKQRLTPKMRVILVGDNPASLIYIRNKKRLCERVGADFELVELDKEISKNDFFRGTPMYDAHFLHPRPVATKRPRRTH